MKNRVAIWIVALLVVGMSLSACGIANELKAVNAASETMMTAFRDGDALASWNLLTPEVQAEVGDIANWQSFIEPRNFSEWKFTNTQFENDVAQVDGEAILGEETYSVVLVLQKVEDYWKFSGINFTFLE